MYKATETNLADLQKEAILILAKLIKFGLVDDDRSVQKAIADPGNPDELRSIIRYLTATLQSVERDNQAGISRKGESVRWV